MNFRKKIWWLLPAGCMLAGILATVLLRMFTHLDWAGSVKEGTVLTIVLSLTATSAYGVIKAYPTKVGILGCALVVGAIAGIAGAWLHGITLSWLFADDRQMNYAWWRYTSVPYRWLLYPALLLLFSVITALYRRMAEIEQRYALQQDAAGLLKEAELFKLRQQLQPHFLYNSLNAISSLIITSPDKAGEMISRLADFLRASVKQGRSELVTLQEELDYLHSYLWIEAIRFGDRLQIDWLNDEIVTGAKLPPFLLQPVMENAIRFGVYGRTGAVRITIHVALQSGMLAIRVTNPYDATMTAAGGTGFGLEGIRRRLYLMYARQDLLQTAEADGHFIITIQIPQ